MMVFFCLKDKTILINWFLQFMPKERNLTVKVWNEVDMQMGNYVRGKFSEIFILWFVIVRFLLYLGFIRSINSHGIQKVTDGYLH